MIPLPQKVHDAMNKPGVSAKLKDVLQQVSSYDNVPRKRAKFQVGITSVYQSLAVLLNILCYYRYQQTRISSSYHGPMK